jgi:hypothetical protein
VARLSAIRAALKASSSFTLLPTRAASWAPDLDKLNRELARLLEFRQ